MSNIKDPEMQAAFLAAARQRKRQMQELRDKGWKLPEIAKHFGVSKQRVHQILGHTTQG